MNDATAAPATDAAPAPNHAERPRGRWLRRALWLVLILAIGWFYVWTARSTNATWHFGRPQRDYYSLLVHGWLKGQLSMDVEVPAALLHVADPYDPNQRPDGVGLHDASYFQGRYYLYFGVAPAALLLLPFRIATGVDLPIAAAVVGFAFLGFLATAATFRSVRRRYFPEAAEWVVAVGVLALGIAGLGPVLVRRTEVWELPIAAGYAFAMLALWLLWEAAHRPALRWLVGASLCLGLAIASRPTYLVALPVLVVPLLWRWRDRGSRRGLLAAAAAVAVPLVVTGLLLAWHNYARFGNPLEFGQRYQLSSMYESKLVHFSARYLSFNAWVYFFAPAHWSLYFPFIRGISAPTPPAGYGGYEDVYGVLANLPLAWFALGAPLALWRRSADTVPLRQWLVQLGLFVAALAGFILFFFGAHGRYMLDFTPALMLAAVLGVLALERFTRQSPIARWLLRAFWLGAAVVSIAFAVFFSLTATHLFIEKQPQTYARIGHRFDCVAGWLERAVGIAHGPVELSVTFDPRPPGERQILARTGEGDETDRVFVESVEGQGVRIGVADRDGATQVSRTIPADGRPHRMRISMGSLFPPANHPFFDGIPPTIVALWTNRIVVTLDDTTVLDAPQPFHAVNPNSFRLAPIESTPGLVKAASMIGRESMTPAQLVDAARQCVRLRLTVPETSDWQPILGLAGRDGRFGVAVRRVDATHVRFAAAAGTEPMLESEPVELSPLAVHALVLSVPRTAHTFGRDLLVTLDGMTAWGRKIGVTWRPETQLTIGRNSAALPQCAAEFAGRILSEETFVEGADPVLAKHGSLRFTLRLPPAVSRREPLLVMGHPGTADFLFIEYAADSVRFGFDHWGGALLQSAVVPLDPTQVHQIEVDLAALHGPPPAAGAGSAGQSVLTVTCDGRAVWREPVTFFWPAETETYVLENPLGGSSCGPRFSGEVMSVGRVPAAPSTAPRR